MDANKCSITIRSCTRSERFFYRFPEDSDKKSRSYTPEKPVRKPFRKTTPYFRTISHLRRAAVTRWLYEAGNSVGCVRIKSIVIRIGMTRHSDNKWKRRSHFKSGARPRRIGGWKTTTRRCATVVYDRIVFFQYNMFFFRFHPLMYFSLPLRHFDFFSYYKYSSPLAPLIIIVHPCMRIT